MTHLALSITTFKLYQQLAHTFIHAIEDGLQDLVTISITMFLPDRSILTPQDHEFTISPTEGREMGNLNDHRPSGAIGVKVLGCNFCKKSVKTVSSPQELHAGWTKRDDPAGQTLTLHQWRRRSEFLRLHQAAGDACWSGTGARRYDDTQTVVSAPSHRAATSVHHEAYQETAEPRRH